MQSIIDKGDRIRLAMRIVNPSYAQNRSLLFFERGKRNAKTSYCRYGRVYRLLLKIFHLFIFSQNIWYAISIRNFNRQWNRWIFHRIRYGVQHQIRRNPSQFKIISYNGAAWGSHDIFHIQLWNNLLFSRRQLFIRRSQYLLEFVFKPWGCPIGQIDRMKSKIVRGFSPLPFETGHPLVHCIETLYDTPAHFDWMPISQK